MIRRNRSIALGLLLFFIASLVALPQNVRAPSEPTITLNATEITDTSVTLSWTSDQPPAGFVPFNGNPYFNNYILRMSNKTLDSQYPYIHSNYEDIWTSTDSQQTTTTVTDLSSSATYYFYILASDYFGGGFSNIVEVQTLPSPTSSPTITPSPTPTPSVPEFPATLAVTFLLMTALATAVMFRRRRQVFS